MWHTAASKPQWVDFSSAKTDCDKFESWKKIFFQYPCLGFFSPEPPRLLCSSQKFIALQIFDLNIRFLKNYPQERVFCNVNFSNLENVLQRNLRTCRAQMLENVRREN